MPANKLLNFIALTAITLLAISFGPAPVNALASPHHHQLVHRHIAHDVISKKKRDVKRCRPRPPTTAQPPVQTTAQTTTQGSAPTSTPQTPVNSTPASRPPPAQGGGNILPRRAGKMGLTWANGDDPELLKRFVTDRVNMLYTWAPQTPSETFGAKALSMVWGLKDIETIKQVLSSPPTDQNNLVLYINEPNEPGQANLDPATACNAFKQHLLPFQAQGYRFATPATSSNPNGLSWVQEFLKLCPEGDFPIVAIHFYDNTFEKFQTYVNLWHDTFGRDIIITEYACHNFNGPNQPSYDEVMSFHRQAAAWLESLPWVLSYAPFAPLNQLPDGVTSANRLMDQNFPNDLGNMYINGWF